MQGAPKPPAFLVLLTPKEPVGDMKGNLWFYDDIFYKKRNVENRHSLQQQQKYPRKSGGNKASPLQNK